MNANLHCIEITRPNLLYIFSGITINNQLTLCPIFDKITDHFLIFISTTVIAGIAAVSHDIKIQQFHRKANKQEIKVNIIKTVGVAAVSHDISEQK